MVDSREKGARAETAVKDELKKLTGLGWERVPSSGALSAKHFLKGDLYVPGRKNFFCVEVKHYAEDQLDSKILTGKSPILLDWWAQAVRQANEVSMQPLLLFKYDRSKVFAARTDIPNSDYPYIFISKNGMEFFVSLLSLYIENDKPNFVS